MLSLVWLFATPWTVACTGLLHPWDFPGKSTRVGSHFLPSPYWKRVFATMIKALDMRWFCVLVGPKYNHLYPSKKKREIRHTERRWCKGDGRAGDMQPEVKEHHQLWETGRGAGSAQQLPGWGCERGLLTSWILPMKLTSELLTSMTIRE